MKQSLLFLTCLFCTCLVAAYGQKIQYSRQTVVPETNPEALQLVANIGGSHHLVTLTSGRFPEIFVFDPQLRLLEKKSLPLKLKERYNIQVLPFKTIYYLYFHVPNKAVHELWKVDATGNAVSLSAPFKNFVDTALNGSQVDCQLLNRNGQLVAISHTYFGALRKIRTTVAYFTHQLEPVQVKRVLFPFDLASETLSQVSLAGNELLVLTTVKDEANGRSLEIKKIDLDAGTMVANTFHAPQHLYVNPLFQYNEKDSSLLLFSTLQNRGQRIVFISRLNAQLQETTPLALLKRQFRDNTVSNYLWVDGQQPVWLNFSTALPQLYARSGRTLADPGVYAPNESIPMNNRVGNRVVPMRTYNSPNLSVRFTLLNRQLAITSDTLVANEKDYNDIEPNAHAQVSLQGKNCLVVEQNLTKKNKGLLLVYVTDKGEMVSDDIPVFGRHDYWLPGTKNVGSNAFVIPYFNKREVGLVKVTYDDEEKGLDH